MDYTSDGDSEVEAYGSGTFELLESGDLKVMTDEGLYRCPFCSDDEKGHSLNDLLQHASGVGAAHDRQAKEKADHRALARHLKGKPVESSGALLQPMLMEVQDPEHTQDEQFVWPWMAILVNMPNEFFGKSANRLKEHYSSFHPVKVHPVYSKGRPTRDAVFEFGNDWSGFRNARAFDAHFAMKGYSKNCWKEMKCECTEPAGWMARADDYSSLGAIGEQLRKNGDVKTLKDIGSEGANKTEKLLSNLACEVKEKEIHLEQLESEFNKHSASLNIMMQKREQQLQSYNQEILKMRQLGQQNTQRIVEENRKLRFDIQDMVDALDAGNKQIEQSEHDKKNLEQKLKNAMRTNHLRLAALEQKKADENVQKLVDKQTRETKAILDDFLRLNKQLEKKQKLELEINHLSGKLQVMELKPGDEDPESREKKDKLKEELKPGDEDPESRVASVTKRHSSGGMRPDPYCDNLFYPGQPVRVGDASVFQAARWLSGCCQSTRVKGTVARVELADVLVFWVSSARLGGTKRLELVQASAPPPQQRARDLAFFCSDNLCFWGISDRCFLRDADALTTPPTAAATTPPMSVVTDTRTTVDVLWQDGTRLHGVPSASLVHFDSHAEVFFPGQRVVSLDAIEDGPAAAAAVPRVGIVRDVNWKDQTVPVSWVVAQQPGAGRRGGGAHGGGRDDDRGERVRSGQGLRPRRLLWRCCRTHCWRRHGSSSGCGCRRRRSFMGRPRC